MAARGYCNAADVASFLGLTLSGAQQTYALSLLETVEALIDGETGRGWLVGPQTGETLRPGDWPDGRLYLRYTPVDTDETLTLNARETWDGADVELVAGVDYEVLDAEGGVFRLVEPRRWARVTADYTPAEGVPAPVRDAAAEWVAALMLPALRPDTYGVESFALPDLSIKFSRSMAGGEMPPTVALKLSAVDSYPEIGGIA